MFLLLLQVAGASVLVRIKDFTVLYKARRQFNPLGFLGINPGSSDSDDMMVGLDRVSASFHGFTSLVGCPGSGKSTLAKALHRRCSEIDGSLQIVDGSKQLFADEIDSHDTAYINEFYYDTYSPSKSVEEICLPLITKTVRGRKMYQLCVQVLDIPQEDKISSLMESQRKCFELMLALLRVESESDRENSTDERSDEGESIKDRGILLLLDEYFDKDTPSVVRKVFTSLRKLRQALEADSEGLLLFQLVIVSHCQVVAESTDWVVAIHKGSIFHEQEPSLLRLPSQFEWRQ